MMLTYRFYCGLINEHIYDCKSKGIMFLREIQGKNKTYLSIVDGYRDLKGHSKQKTVVSFGAIDQLNKKSIQNLAERLLTYCDITIGSFDKAEEISRLNWGAIKVIEQLWKLFKIELLLKRLLKVRKIQIDLKSAITLMLADRLCHPASKFKTYNNQNYYKGIKHVELHQLYRSLDFLSEHKDEIEQHIYKQNKQLFDLELNVVFFDVTTFYFESTKQDELRDFGYSKDCKFNEVQVMLSMLVNEQGRPIGFDLFKGNSYEGHTINKALKRLEEQYKIKKVIIVADRGLNSGLNLEQIKELGFEYIVGSKIRSLSKGKQEEILDLEQYQTINGQDESEFKYKIMDLTKTISRKKKIESKLICTWSAKRARKDQQDRERLVTKAIMLIENNKLTEARGAKKYIKQEVKKTVLNEEKIFQDKRWDGFYGIETSDPDLNPQTILEAYNNLWHIEESFKILKSHLEARPIFHWTPKRIKGHFVLSYLAFLFERTLELGLKETGATVNSIRKSLNNMECSEVDVEGKRFYLYSKLTNQDLKLLEYLHLKVPPKMQAA